MERCAGGNLAQRIYAPSKRRLTLLEVLRVGADVAEGLAYLHPSVVHRDLKVVPAFVVLLLLLLGAVFVHCCCC